MSFLWFVAGAGGVLAVLGLNQWSREREVTLQWWKWALVVLWVFLAAGVLAFITTSLGEREAKAALTGGMFFIPMTVVAGGLLWRFVILRKS